MKKILKFFLLCICIFISIFIYSKYIGVKGVILKEYRVVNNNIPKNFNGLKIVHFSDIHYGISITEKELKKIVKEINQSKPDLVVFTGDLFDKNYKIQDKEIEVISTFFNQIEATLGKYAIKGENDDDKEKFETIMTNSNFINLNDTFDYIYNKDYTPILLTGISSNLTNKKNISEKIITSENEIIQYNKAHNIPIYSILLLHEPDYVDKINIDNYQLILAGHSHNGQIKLPFIQNLFLEDGAQKYYKNHYHIKNTELYISSGLGTHKYPYRLLNKPSINLYRLEAK